MEILHLTAVKDFEKGTAYGERCLTYEYHNKSDKALVIISHSDLDGVTSAINMLFGAIMMGYDTFVYLERTSTEATSTELAIYAYNELKSRLHHYKNVEIAFTDRMFMNPQEFLKNVSLEHVLGKTLKFTWYDHHEGNYRSREELNNKFGLPNIDVFEDYEVITDIYHCGASISAVRMCKRVLECETIVEEYIGKASKFMENLIYFSKKVNLWDTFLWKKEYKSTDNEYILGQMMGSIDKMFDNEKDVFKHLIDAAKLYDGLDNKEVDAFILECYTKYKELVSKVYEDVLKDELGDKVYRFNPKTNKHYNIVLLPVEWKYSSAVKEMFIEEFDKTDCVITFNKFGGTVYTKDGYTEFPSYNLAEFIGTMYGFTGGGHQNAAGFKIHKDFPAFYDERKCLSTNLERIRLALNEFMFELIEGGLHCEFRNTSK